MRKPRFTDSEIAHYLELFGSDKLMGVAFFIREEGQTVVVGEVAGSGIAGAGDTFYEAVDTFGILARCQDERLVTEFGPEAVQFPLSDQELIVKAEAFSTLLEEVKDRAGVISVRETGFGFSVKVAENASYEGPWTWRGFPVHAETSM